MTEITRLLNEEQEKEFDNLMYGEEGKSGLLKRFPSWAGINDVGIDCICCMLILKQQHDVAAISKNQLYSLYCAAMDFIAEEYPDIKTSCSVLNRREFAKFINRYPQLISLKKHITINYRNREAAKPDRIEYVMLMRDENRNPVAEAKRGNVYYDFPLTTGMEIHTCNEFLRSLGLGNDIHFETYLQYGMLLIECSELLEKKKPLA